MLVEFLGVGGVGKTTLMQEILQQPDFSDWQTAWDFEKEQKIKIVQSCGVHEEIYQTILLQKEHWTSHQGFEPKTAEEYISYLRRVLSLDQFLRRNKTGKAVLADELLLQNFSTQILEMTKSSPELARLILSHRNVVFIVGFRRQIVNNIRKREAEGAYYPFLPGGNDDYLMQYTADFQNHLANVVDAAIELGSNCLTIDSNRGIDGCVAEISSFLRDVQQDAARES